MGTGGWSRMYGGGGDRATASTKEIWRRRRKYGVDEGNVISTREVMLRGVVVVMVLHAGMGCCSTQIRNQCRLGYTGLYRTYGCPNNCT